MTSAIHSNDGYRRSYGRFILVLTLAVCFLISAQAFGKEDPAVKETKLGKEAAEKFASDKNTKFIEDPTVVERIQKIGNAIAAVANEKKIKASYGSPDVYKFDYTFRIVEDKAINAFSLPGGYVYVNKALVEYAQSDDELAGVIAHEVAHISHHHAMYLLKAQEKQMIATAIAILAALAAGGDNGDMSTLAYAGQLIAMAKTSAYGQDAEYDADRTAVAYLVNAGYNPVGMLTFMERLARDEGRKPTIEWGIFATHPESRRRAREIISEIGEFGHDINRRLVTTYMRVQVKPIDNTPAHIVSISETEIVRLADAGGKTSSQRAEAAADALHAALLAGAKLRDVRVSLDGAHVMMLGKTVITPTPEDAALAGTTISDVCKSAARQIQRAIQMETLNQSY